MRFSENALPWALFAVVTVALVCVLMNLQDVNRSAARATQWEHTVSGADTEQAIRQVFQTMIDARDERLIELEAKLEACGCH